MKSVPTKQRLSELLNYSPETGIFKWKVRAQGRKINEPAGTAHARGYRQIRIDGFLYMEHCLAWLLTHGNWPEQIDHINGDKGDNRISNLRPATRAQNRANSKANSDNISGIKGVRKTRHSTWLARIRVEGKLINLGSFKTVEEASAAYASAAKQFFGEYARWA